MSPRMGARSGAQLTEPRFSQSLETGLLIMKGFTAERPIQGIAEVAERMEASRSTIHRYMATLVVLGMLEQDHVSRRYRLGTLPNDLGNAALSLHRSVRALDGELVELRRQTGCTARLAVLIEAEAMIVAQASSRAKGQGLLGVQLRRGARVPSHSTALGKALLSQVEQKQLKDLLSDLTLAKHTQATITGKRALLAHIANAAERGFATEIEEHQKGVIGIAVPIRDADGAPSAALGLVACMPEVSSADLEGHLDALRSAATKLEGRMEPALPLRGPRR